MKIFIVGSTGRVGKSLIKSLSTSDHEVFAGARKIEEVPQFDNVKPVFFDLDWSAEEMAEKLEAIDMILNVSGSAGKSLLKVDLYGAVKLMQAAELAHIKRFIHLSTVFSLDTSKWTSAGINSLKDYYIAKHFSDLYLLNNSNLDYTILQPGALTEAAGTGLIEINDEISAANTIEDVAETLKELISSPQTIGKVISMHNGNQPIADALKEV